MQTSLEFNTIRAHVAVALKRVPARVRTEATRIAECAKIDAIAVVAHPHESLRRSRDERRVSNCHGLSRAQCALSGRSGLAQAEHAVTRLFTDYVIAGYLWFATLDLRGVASVVRRFGGSRAARNTRRRRNHLLPDRHSPRRHVGGQRVPVSRGGGACSDSDALAQDCVS